MSSSFGNLKNSPTNKYIKLYDLNFKNKTKNWRQIKSTFQV